MAVEIIPKTIVCPRCKSKLSYLQSDIKKKKVSYTVYHNVEETSEENYIKCPNCTFDVKI